MEFSKLLSELTKEFSNKFLSNCQKKIPKENFKWIAEGVSKKSRNNSKRKRNNDERILEESSVEIPNQKKKKDLPK